MEAEIHLVQMGNERLGNLTCYECYCILTVLFNFFFYHLEGSRESAERSL